ncbi:MAG: OmpA family protein [Alphaproteobacteria bacterium]|nr:OmpA family protein [Alphaproteobacteria bacterium]
MEACKRDFLTAIAAVEVALKPVAAAPAPARPAAPKQTVFLVYFGHNSAEIGIEPKLEINKVAREFAEQKTNSIAIIGHSDRSGNPQANLRLSRKRARAVADTLVQLGVPRNKIRVQSVGEGRGLVATPDGVKEPQNRVVEIRLQP